MNRWVFGLVVSLLFLGVDCSALSNPSAVYCTKMGYRYESDDGICVTGDGARLAAWEFYRGKVGGKYSFCARKGYDTVSEKVNEGSYYIERPVCINPSTKKKTPMFDLMAEEGLKVTVEEAPADGGVTYTTKDAGSPPQSFDWRNYNGHSYIGPVRDQGNCGSCYSFGAAAAAEGTYNYATGNFDGNVSDYSESYIIWCLGRLPEYSSHFFGCNGADYEYKELEALTNYGIIGESLFPYTITDPGSCTHWGDPTTKFSSWQRVTTGDINAMKNAIMTYGVIDVAVYAGNGFQSYSGGIYTDTKTSCPQGYYTSSNHAVALVGWGTDPVYGDYWILRNSWGPDWGESGYMRIQANSARVACAPAYLTYSNVTTTTTTTTTSTTASTTTTLPTCTGTKYPQCSGLNKKTCNKAYMLSTQDLTYHTCKWNPAAKTCNQYATCTI
ncbi:MAG: C1 family peptidase [Candidatus Altiarchaeota archaeon]